jgi:ABC-2 type transport system ATP-binding protein
LRDPGQRAQAQLLLANLLGTDVQLDSDHSSLSARERDPDAVGHVLAELARSDIAVTEFALGQPSLDEVFLALTGHAAGDHTDQEAAA